VKRLKAFGAFWYEFVIGDDWRIAIAVVVGLAGTSLVVHVGHQSAWWLLPVIVISMLTISLWHASRERSGEKPNHVR
jgi:uncharacterized membrane protein YccC